MSDRAQVISGFLKQNGYAEARRQDFPADFSPRRYARLSPVNGPDVIFMDADDSQKTSEFVALAQLLRDMEITAPQIYAADIRTGLVLMQDFGARNMGGMVDAGGDHRLYCGLALSVLSRLHDIYDPALASDDLPRFNAALLTTQVSLFAESYMPFTLARPATQGETQGFAEAWIKVLAETDALPRTLMLRDYMLDNLMHLPGNENWRSVGVLDFQDAGLGPMAYDLASLCEHVRRDGPGDLVSETLDLYAAAARQPIDRAQWLRHIHIFAAQRHMRILGVIARLAMAGRSEKSAYLPRVKKYLNGLMQDDALLPIRQWLISSHIDL